MEAESIAKGAGEQVHLSSSPVGSLQGLRVIVLHLTPGWPDGVTESRWGCEADEHPTLHQLVTFVLFPLHWSLTSLNIFLLLFLADTLAQLPLHLRLIIKSKQCLSLTQCIQQTGDLSPR